MQDKKIKILFLYAEIMSYTIALIKQYVNSHNAEVHVVHWDTQKKTPYIAPTIDRVIYYGKSEFTLKTLSDFALQLQPDFVVTSGWMDKMYINVCIKLRKENIPVIAASDTQFYNNVRQNIGKYYFKLFYKKAFSHIWVAGAYQFEYAKKLGYKNNEILFNFLSADLEIFNPIYSKTIESKKVNYPHQFLYVGRFAHEKGLDLLINAFNNLETKKDWKLCLVGNGPLKSNLPNQKDIEIHDFVQPEKLEEFIAQSGCFVLPSKMEPWALVLHEFSAAGMPIICSNACGAAPTFVISGYNGYIFESGNQKDLQHWMQKIINSSDENLILMSQKSHKIGQRLDPESNAANSLSVLKQTQIAGYR